MSGRILKIIAILTMILDHIGASIIYALIVFHNHKEYVSTYYVLRSIGRVAFPLYVFLLVEGFTHTRNVKKYMLSMLCFILLSELPFDLALGKGDFPNWHSQNVFITLFFGLCVLLVYKCTDEVFSIADKRGVFIKLSFTALICTVAYFVRSDYKWGGVLAVVIAYLIKTRLQFVQHQRLVYFVEMLAITTVLSLCFNGREYYSMCAIPLAVLYNGQRGNIKHKYLYYGIYPVHLLVLGIYIRIAGLV